MSRAGRKPAPTYKKVIRGDFGKGAPPPNEPQPDKVERTRRVPKSLKGSSYAEAHWKVVSARLVKMGALGDVDLDSLEQYCYWYDRWREASVEVMKRGDVLRTTAGNLIQNPYTAVARRASEMMLKYMTELGLTPSSRSRIQLAQTGDGDDLFDD